MIPQQTHRTVCSHTRGYDLLQQKNTEQHDRGTGVGAWREVWRKPGSTFQSAPSGVAQNVLSSPNDDYNSPCEMLPTKRL